MRDLCSKWSAIDAWVEGDQRGALLGEGACDSAHRQHDPEDDRRRCARGGEDREVWSAIRWCALFLRHQGSRALRRVIARPTVRTTHHALAKGYTVKWLCVSGGTPSLEPGLDLARLKPDASSSPLTPQGSSEGAETFVDELSAPGSLDQVSIVVRDVYTVERGLCLLR